MEGSKVCCVWAWAQERDGQEDGWWTGAEVRGGASWLRCADCCRRAQTDERKHGFSFCLLLVGRRIGKAVIKRLDLEELRQGYGMTESLGLGTINRGADYLKRPTSCGLARMCAVRVGGRGLT